MLAMIFFIFVPLGFVEHLQSVHLTFIKFGKILTIISLNVLFCFILSLYYSLDSNYKFVRCFSLLSMSYLLLIGHTGRWDPGSKASSPIRKDPKV